MSMKDGIDLFKHFQILVRPEGNYGFRFIAPPYTDDEADSMKVLGHNREPHTLTAQSIVALLNKFGVTEEQFRGAYNEFYRAMQR